MADPFTIIGLVDTVAGWSLQIYQFLSAVSDAPDEIASLTAEIHTLQGIFPHVRDVAVKMTSVSVIATDPRLVPMLNGVLEECRAEFKKLLTFVVNTKQDDHLHSWERLLRKAKWVLSSDAVKQSIVRLDRCKATLMLGLQLSSLQIGMATSSQLQSTEQRKEDISPKFEDQMSNLRIMFQKSVADIQSEIHNFMGVITNIEYNNEQRLDGLHGDMTEPLQSLPGSVKIDLGQSSDPGPNSSGTGEESSKPPMSVAEDMMKEAFTEVSMRLGGDRSFREQLAKASSGPDLVQNIVGTMSQIFGNAKKSVPAQRLITEAMEEASQIIIICSREYELYPEPSLRVKLTQLYATVLELLLRLQKWQNQTASRKAIMLGEPWQGFERQVKDLRKISDEVMKEVEYLDRRETRMASIRLKYMERDQRRILNAVEEQKKIMAGMQEQRQVLDMVKDQQKVLLSMQNILMQLQLPAPSGAGSNASLPLNVKSTPAITT